MIISGRRNSLPPHDCFPLRRRRASRDKSELDGKQPHLSIVLSIIFQNAESRRGFQSSVGRALSSAVAHLVLVSPMRIPMKARKIVIGVILLAVLLVGGCAARVWMQDTVAKRFCKSLVSKIEQDRG
jgi:hypothetical protein